MRKAPKALFLAFSGVRIFDPELLKVGLTLPGFVERGKVIASLPSLSLITLAAYCPETWEVSYREVDEIVPDLARSIAEEGFTLVAIASFTARIEDAYVQADKLRQFGITVILGGLHVTVLPLEALEHADAIVVGEGEFAWRQLTLDFELGRLEKVYNSKTTTSFSMKFSEAKLPRFDLLDIRKYNRLTLQTARGCPLDCSFCAASRQISSYKLKPIEVVERELDAILAIWPGAFVELADDNTFVNKKWAKELMRMFGKKGIRWFTETDISVADDDELLELMAKSGCAQILIGFESASPEALKKLDSGNWKRKRFDSYVEKIGKIQSFGISVNGCFILGFDTDTEKSFDATSAFVEESGLSEVQATVLTPFPGTMLYAELEKQGRLLKPRFWERCTLFDLNFRPMNMTEEEFKSGFSRMIKGLYSPQATNERKRKRLRVFRKSGIHA